MIKTVAKLFSLDRFLEKSYYGDVAHPRDLVRSCQQMAADGGCNEAKALLEEHFGSKRFHQLLWTKLVASDKVTGCQSTSGLWSLSKRML